jgi:hypothetical protein
LTSVPAWKSASTWALASTQARERVTQVRGDQLEPAASERRTAAHQLVEDAAERVEVRARVDRCGARALLRRHVGRRPKHALRLAGAAVDRQLGNTEVEHLHALAADDVGLGDHEQVGRLLIDKAYARELERKRDAYREAFGDRKATFLTLISTHGVRADDHAQRLGIRSLTMAALLTDSWVSTARCPDHFG